MAKKKRDDVPGPEPHKMIGLKASTAWAAWLERAAKNDRATVAGFIDRAVADRAKANGFEEQPPDRIP